MAAYRLILHWKNVIGIFCVWLPCSTFTLIGAFVVYFFFKMRKEDRQNELTKERPVKWWNKAKIIGYGLLLSMMPQKNLKIEKRNHFQYWDTMDWLLLCCSFLHSVPAALTVRVLIKWIANFIYFRMNFLPDTLTIGQLMKITFYIFKVLLKKQHLY